MFVGFKILDIFTALTDKLVSNNNETANKKDTWGQMKCSLGLYYSLVLRCEMTKSTRKMKLHQPIESKRMELKWKIRTFETEWSICKQSSKKGGTMEQCETVGKQ